MSLSSEIVVPIVIGTFPIRVQQIVIPIPVYEIAFAMPGTESSSKFQVDDDSKGNSEVFESDEATYRPNYPVFKGLSAEVAV
jgi:hypothetical protein